MATKDDNRKVTLCEGRYRKDVFSYFKKNIAKEKIFISVIPFVRNLIEYIEGDQSPNYKLLTSCLHVKADTHTVIGADILAIVNNCLPSTNNQNIAFSAKVIKDLIYETADFLEQETPVDEILLENKITFSMAIRLKAEEYMLSKIPNGGALVINSNQTSELLRIFKGINSDKSTITILERVNLMTPENIHINAFMYEPLIDISVFHLVSLYKSIKQLI